MNLELTPQDMAFRQEVQAFLTSALTPHMRRAGLRTTSIFSEFEASMSFQRALHDQGWAAPDWPLEYGGTDWSQMQKAIFHEECQRANSPATSSIGIQMLGPMIIRYGTTEQKRVLLPRILSTADVWCQGYSEPEAGSDLASLQMKAEKEGDDYVLNGSKIWTSLAHHANKMFCLVRTRKSEKPQAGISFLLVDLDLPGITVSPIVSLDGEVEQCQVFFEDVRVASSQRLGEENQGWEIAKYLLEHERGGYSYYVALDKQLSQIKTMASSACSEGDVPFIEDPVFTAELAELEIDKLALEYTEYRLKTRLEEQGKPGALSSMIKVTGTELGQALDEMAVRLRGQYLAPLQNHCLDPDFTGPCIGPVSGINVMNRYLNNRASTIYGGTAQIQRNIIARMVLAREGV